MAKVTIVQVIYNNRRFIEPVFNAIFNQTYKDFNVVVVIAGNDDGGKELLKKKFPQVEIIDPGYNIGFSKGHNLVFSNSNAEFFQLVNPDMIMEPDYVEQMVKAFTDSKVASTTGKLYQVPAEIISSDFVNLKSYILNHKFLDTTGVIISKSGRARDRGQHEVDNGQYDNQPIVDAVSGAGCMYRALALRDIRLEVQGSGLQKLTPNTYNLEPSYEYFDEDFHSYWEDVDLAWRMKNKGWKNVFVPTAVGYHGRTAGSSRGGYLHFVDFIKHHRALSSRIRQLNYKNHILMYIKNSPVFYPQFFIREFFMFFYSLFFEISTFKVIPELFKLIPVVWKKRKNK